MGQKTRTDTKRFIKIDNLNDEKFFSELQCEIQHSYKLKVPYTVYYFEGEDIMPIFDDKDYAHFLEVMMDLYSEHVNYQEYFKLYVDISHHEIETKTDANNNKIKMTKSPKNNAKEKDRLFQKRLVDMGFKMVTHVTVQCLKCSKVVNINKCGSFYNINRHRENYCGTSTSRLRKAALSAVTGNNKIDSYFK